MRSTKHHTIALVLGILAAAAFAGPVDPVATDEALATLSEQIAARDARIAKLEQDYANLFELASLVAAAQQALPAGPQLCDLGATVEWPSRVRELASQTGFERVHVIYQRDIDPDDDAVLDADLLEAAILTTIPEDFAGEAVLDWEGKAVELARGPPSPESDAARAQLIAAIDLADELRPAASWSIYGLPPSYRPDSWIEGPDKWDDWLVNLAPVLERSESICVSLYRFYKDEQQNGDQARGNVHRDFKTIRAAREIAGDRRVMVFFMDVYHDGGTQPHRGDPIHVVEMQQAVRHFGHCGADLVVYWRQQKDVTGALAEYVIRSWAEAVAIEETGPLE